MITLTQQPQPPARGLALSATLHLAGALLLVQFGGAILAPPQHRTGATLILIPQLPREVEPPAPLPKPLPKQALRAFKLPKLPTIQDQPARKAALIEAPAIQPVPAREVRSTMTAIQAPPPPQIRTGVLDEPAAPQIRSTSPAVQTGGFASNTPAEPRITPALLTRPAGFENLQAASQRKAPAITQQAGFNNGAHATRQNEQRRVASAGVFGGTGTATPIGRVAAVTDGGFGAASLGAASSRPHQQSMQAGFGETVAAKLQPTRSQPVSKAASDTTPIEITFKPRPAYTEEARRLQLEGEVLIEAVFSAGGQVEILRILQGLGHGLNESAIAAVRSIRFRPAMKNGHPVDSKATVRMRFELAY